MKDLDPQSECWKIAYRALPSANNAKTRRVKDPVSFAEAAFDLDIAFQVSWKATTEGILEELESRFAPEYYLDHVMSGRNLIMTCESDRGKRKVRFPCQRVETDALVGAVAQLVELVALALVPLNDGDDSHYIFVSKETKRKLEGILGREFYKALRLAR